MFMLTVVLGVAINHVDYSSEVTEAYLSRFKARSSLVSMTNLALKWLSAEVADGERPRARAAAEREYLTDFDSLRILALVDLESCEVKVYDLDYDPERLGATMAFAGEENAFPPSVARGYMVRAVVEKKAGPPLTVESVYRITEVALSEESSREVLEEKPLYWRELFRK
jgi:hypothetical protein